MNWQKWLAALFVLLALSGCASMATRRDHIDFASDEVRGQFRQPIKAILRPMVFDRHVLVFDVAGFP